MRTEIKYLELKSGFSGNGPAWIGLVSFSKSGKTIYFDGKAFQRMGSARIQGNFMDILSGDEYWISGVKKDLSDRHKFGGGKVFVENAKFNKGRRSIKKRRIELERELEKREIKNVG